ncbi:MAG TPA: DUF1549 domain-containing protein, partial [Gemmataceae bacterium]|nr:DUF1549 domain-containing protein [Gemmataceae bacterium]
MFSSRTSFCLGLSAAGAVLLAVLVLRPAGIADSAAADRAALPPINFARDIQPILAENCFQCHGPDPKQRKAKLRLDVEKEALAHGDAIVPGHADRSELVERVSSDDREFRMPPPKTGKRLKPEQIALLRRWIDAGAKWSKHWAFVKPERPPLPTVKNKTWTRNPIDTFIAAGLEREALRPSPEADKTTLIRRVTLDLTGLPPTPTEVDAFLADQRPDAYERLVDRLLESPRFGERLALDWLDAARFADTHGYHIDSGRDMTKWREWVINAFNKNMPFDRFTIEQIAGDLLPDATLDHKIASGFNRNHMINFEGGAIPEEYQTAYIVDRINTTATVWLGLTLGCCQCHDHKYDPFTQKEFYQLYAFFNNVPEKGIDGQKGNATPVLKLPTPEQGQRLAALAKMIKEQEERLSALTREVDAAQAEWEKEAVADPAVSKLAAKIKNILALPSAKRNQNQTVELRDYYRGQFAPVVKQRQERLGKLRKEHDELDKQIPTAMVMEEMPKPRDTFLLIRGQYDKKGEKVIAGVPANLHPVKTHGSQPVGVPNRLQLARWLIDPENPLTARVTVNRFWQMYFGTGIVKTAEDFGTQGEWPSHPELLDWLATEFVGRGWDVKHIQRLILTSATYRQASATRPEFVVKDPENRLLARMSRLRLPAEFIRDQALAASGLLDGRIGGKSASPYQPYGIWEELSYREDFKNFSAQVYEQSHGKDL